MADEQLDTSVPQTARIWNYRLGGEDNFAVDRDSAKVLAEPERTLDFSQPVALILSGALGHIADDEPGVTSAPLWRPESGDAQPLDVARGVARKL